MWFQKSREVLVGFQGKSPWPPCTGSLSSILPTSHRKSFPDFSPVCEPLFRVNGQSIKLEGTGGTGAARLVRGGKAEGVGVRAAQTIWGKEE